MRTKIFSMLIFTTILFVVFISSAYPQAKGYPNKQVQLLVPLPAGSGVDLFFRLLAEDLQKNWKVNVTVVNKMGAGGAIAASDIANGKKDGYTLYCGLLGPLASMTAANPNSTVNLLRDFDPIAVDFGYAPVVMVSRGDSKFKSLEEMIDYAKKKPGELIIATGMVGTYLYLEAELMKRVANINITTLPLPGVMDAITTLLGGHSDLAMSSDVAVRSYISTGKMRGLACDIKSILFPDIPTFIEKGFTKIDLVPILAILGPKGMPREVVEVWGKALKAAANDPKLVSEFNKLGLNVDFRTQDLSTMFKKEVEKYSRFTPEELGWK